MTLNTIITGFLQGIFFEDRERIEDEISVIMLDFFLGSTVEACGREPTFSTNIAYLAHIAYLGHG